MCSKVYIAQGCSLSPILFSVFINGLLKEVEQAGLGVELSDGSTIGGMLFADDFVGVSSELQRLINVEHAYCCKWRLKANVSKSAVVVFARELVEGSWNWGEQALPRLSKYTYLGVDFTSDGAWDEHESRVQLLFQRKKELPWVGLEPTTLLSRQSALKKSFAEW